MTIQMNTERRLAFDQEIALGKEFIAAGDLDRAFRHLQRAHVIGQVFVRPHAESGLEVELAKYLPACSITEIQFRR